MKVKFLVLVCLTGAVVLFVGYDRGLAKSKTAGADLKIGVVSVQRIFSDSQRSAKYRDEANSEQVKAEAEMEKLGKEIEAGEAGLRTLKAGSDDSIERVKEILEKRGAYEALKEFYKQQRAMKERRMVEGLYKDILRLTKEVGDQKGLALVFEQSEPEFPIGSANDLTLTISTNKLLYSAGCVDITDDVIARLDEK